MVAINTDASEINSLSSIELAEPIDAVGRLDIITSSSRFLTRFSTGTATLIAPNKILTAAHVIDSDQDGAVDVEDLGQYSFNLGDNADTPDQSVGISGVNLHPAWVDAEENRFSTVDGREVYNAQYDLAVLTLDSNVTDIAPLSIAPNIPEFADNTFLLGETGTLIGYGNTSRVTSGSATTTNNGARRAAENIIDSVDDGLIRFDYDSTFEFQQTPDSGINSPSFDGSTPEVIPVPSSSPIPLPLEGGIGEGDSGGPLLVSNGSGDPIIVGVASEFIDPDAFSIPIPGYGSVSVYTALSRPSTLRFLADEGLLSSAPGVAAGLASNSDELLFDDVSGARSSGELTGVGNYNFAQADIFSQQQNELDIAPGAEI